MSKRAILAIAACLLSWSGWLISTVGASTRLVVAYAKPSALRPGAQRTVTLFGAGFAGPSGGPTVAVDGPGIAVSAVRPVSAERLRVTLTVASDAAPGLRDVTVIQSDARTARAALVVTDGRPPKLRGLVRASSGERVSDARVTLFDADLSFFREARTSLSGRWAMAAVPLGTCRLWVAAEGYDYEERDVTVKDSARSDFRLVPESHPGSWGIIGDTAPELFDATDIGILMADGRVFYCHDTQDPVVFDPASAEKTFPAASPSEQGCTAATLLADDRIVFIGGQSPADPGSFTDAVPWVKAYRPSGWSLLPTLQLAAGRWYPGLARLADGSLLVMGGGMTPDARRTATAERFDPGGETWTYTGSMLAPAEYPPAALLYTGEVFEPSTESWRLAGNSALPRKRPEVVQLPDGRILAAAGEVEGLAPVPDVLGIVKWTDLYDPVSDRWRRVADMLEFREYHAITLLVPDGRVLTTGGTRIKFQVGPSSANVEAYSPPYLFRGVRPTITSMSTTAAPRGTVLTLSVLPETEITRVVLMGTGAHTHWVDGGIPRRLVLPVTQTGATVQVMLPTDPNLLPLGHYLLFAMVDGIPSNGVVARVAASQ